MRRSPWFRGVAAFAAAWIGLALSEPPGYHGCPMHGAGAPRAESGERGAEDASAPKGHSHGADVTTNAEQPTDAAPAQSQHDPSHSQPCLCLGACAGSSPATRTVAPPVVELLETLPTAPLPAATRDRAPATRGAHVLPFANGPPSTT